MICMNVILDFNDKSCFIVISLHLDQDYLQQIDVEPANCITLKYANLYALVKSDLPFEDLMQASSSLFPNSFSSLYMTYDIAGLMLPISFTEHVVKDCFVPELYFSFSDPVISALCCMTSKLQCLFSFLTFFVLIHQMTSRYISCTSNYCKDMIQSYSKVLEPNRASELLSF